MKAIITKSLIIISLCVSSFTLFSQNNIELNIFDENKAPVSYSNIVLYDGNDNMITGTTSLDGVAVFKNIAKNDYKLCATYIGYKDTCISINYDGKKELKFTINLVPTTATLGEVTITAKKPTITVNSDNNISVNIENSKLKDAEDIIEILKYMPGVIATPDGFTVFGSPDYVFMINGKEIVSPQEMDELKPEDIKDIEIMTSNAKLDATKKYAINIKTIKRKDFFGVQVYDRLEHNRAFGNDTKLSLMFNKNKVQQSLSFNNSLGTYKQSETSDLRIFLNQNNIYTISDETETTMKWISNDLYYGINYDIDTSQSIGLQLYGSISQPKDISDIESVICDTDFYFNRTIENAKNYNFQTSVNYFYKMPKAGELSFVADYYTKNANLNQDITENQTNIIIDSENKYSLYALKGDYTFPVSKIKTKSSFGFKLHRTENENVSTPNTLFADDLFNNKNNLTEQSAAGYFQFNTQMSKITLSGGLRFEYYYKKIEDILQKTENLKEDTDFFPNLSLTYNISEKHVTMLNYSKNINRQAYNNLSAENFYTNPYLYRVANINIKPTTINSISLVYIYAGFLQVQAGYANKKNHTNLYCSSNDSIIIAKYENFDKQDLNLGISASMSGKRHYTSVGVEFSKLLMDFPNELDELDFPKINFSGSLNNTFNITLNFSSIFSFSYCPKNQYDWIITDPEFNIWLGLRHFFFDKSLRLAVYYQHNPVYKYISRFNNIEQYHTLANKRHIYSFSLLYKFKFNQKWVEENNSIEAEKQRM